MDSPRMDKDRSHMTKSILHITLKIIYLLTGEDYTVMRTYGKRVICNSRPCVSGGQSRTQSPITVPPPHSLIHERHNDQKILELTNKIIQLLTGEVPIRCEDVTVYFSMEEWEYIEGHRDLYKDIFMHHQPLNCLKIGKDITQIIQKMLILTVEIIYLLAGEGYTVVKKTSRECETTCSRPRVSGGQSRTQSPITVPPPHSLIHERRNDQKILELTNKIIQLLTGEVPIRCEHVTVYFSLEEWEYIEGHRGLYKDVMMENHRPLTSLDGPNSGNPSEEHLILSPGCETEDNDITRDSPGENPITPNIHPVLHSADTSSGSSVHEECSPDTSDTVAHSTAHRGSIGEGCIAQKTKCIIYQPAHTSEKPFSCSECGKRFTWYAELIRHKSTHTGEKPFSCSECGKGFRDKSALILHERLHTGEKLFSCSVCGKDFTWKSYLVRHQRSHTGEKPFSCSECGKRFTRKSVLVTHQKTHTGEKPFSCSECGKRFAHKSALAVHQLCHTAEKNFSCSECGKHFTHKLSLDNHLRLHTGEKPFSCSKCGKCFAQGSGLVIHGRQHRGGELFSCSVCGKLFAEKSTLTVHQRSHTGEKPFSCSECGKRFSVKSNLRVHQLSHTDGKPFSCSECGRHFARKAALDIHQRSHTGERPFSCSECGKRFAQKSALNTHERCHTGEKPFSCSQCRKLFRFRSNLVSHKKIHIGENVFPSPN